MKVISFLVALSGLFVSGFLHADIVFFSNDQAGFQAAMASMSLLGTEDFESSSLSNNQAATFSGPLSTTSTASPYDSGISFPMTVETDNGTDLVAFKNRSTVATTVVFANSGGATLDWKFNSTMNVVGIGFNPVVFTGQNTNRTIDIQVFDTSNVLLNSITVTGNDQGTNFLGIQALAGDMIGRINFNGQGSSSAAGDNAAIYSVPESGSCLITGTWLVATLIRRRRSR